MTQGRHSYVKFFPSDWIAGTARMTRTQRSVYFDICLYTWDKAESVPAAELPLILGDLPEWREIVDALVAARKLEIEDDGSVVNARAAMEAEQATALWRKKSEGGKRGAAKTNQSKSGNKSHQDSGSSTPIGNDDFIDGETADGMGPGVPSQNQNQNQNQNQKIPSDTSLRSISSGVVGKDADPRQDLPPSLDRESPRDVDFDRLWGAWQWHKTPKGSRHAACAEWKHHVRKPGIESGPIIEAAIAYCTQCKHTDTNTQHVERWIKQHRWEDDHELSPEGTNGTDQQGSQSKSERAKAAIRRSAVAGGYAGPEPGSEASIGDNAVSVFPDAKAVRQRT